MEFHGRGWSENKNVEKGESEAWHTTDGWAALWALLLFSSNSKLFNGHETAWD